MNAPINKISIFEFRNPTKGVIINEPDGENVYAGLIKDYVGEVSLNLFKNRISIYTYHVIFS